MADQNELIKQEIRAEIKRSKKLPKRQKKSGRGRMLPLLLVMLAVLGAVGYAAYRNLDSMDSLRRRLSYNKVEQDADGKAELFRYSSDRSADYTMLGDDLLIVSTTRVQLLDSMGQELWTRTVGFDNPAVARGGKTAAVYDVGGKTLFLLDERGLLRDMSGESGNGVIAASLNASGYLALTTLKSGYRAAVTVYDPSGTAVFTFNSSERYVTDARVLDDNRHLAAVTPGESDGVYASTLTFYALDSEQKLDEATFSGSMILALGGVGGKLAALEDDRLTLFGPDGSLAGSCRFDYPYLRAASMDGDGYAVLLLSRYRSGSALRLMTADAEGNVLGTLDEQREIVDISAAGAYVAVLYTDSLTIYNRDLSVCAALNGTDFAKQTIMRPDGTALLVGASRAWLFIPG